MPRIGVVMGSDSDLEVMKDAGDILKEFAVEYEYKICSAHRLPLETADYARGARERGIEVIIAGAGGAAHLPGVIASYTLLPVIGIPIKTNSLSGIDSLYSIVQMPRGIPVATVAINGGANAALLALQILSLKDEDIWQRLEEYRHKMAQEVRGKDKKLHSIGAFAYLNRDLKG